MPTSVPEKQTRTNKPPSTQPTKATVGGFFNSAFENSQVIRRDVDPEKLIKGSSTSTLVQPNMAVVFDGRKRTGEKRTVKKKIPEKIPEKIQNDQRLVLDWEAVERGERAWKELMEAEEMERKKRMEKSAGNS